MPYVPITDHSGASLMLVDSAAGRCKTVFGVPTSARRPVESLLGDVDGTRRLSCAITGDGGLVVSHLGALLCVLGELLLGLLVAVADHPVEQGAWSTLRVLVGLLLVFFDFLVDVLLSLFVTRLVLIKVVDCASG